MEISQLNEKLGIIEKNIGYEFNNKTVLRQAFIRKSYAEENVYEEGNEVLEFVGDTALSMVIVKKMTEHFGNLIDIAKGLVW